MNKARQIELLEKDNARLKERLTEANDRTLRHEDSVTAHVDELRKLERCIKDVGYEQARLKRVADAHKSDNAKLRAELMRVRVGASDGDCRSEVNGTGALGRVGHEADAVKRNPMIVKTPDGGRVSLTLPLPLSVWWEMATGLVYTLTDRADEAHIEHDRRFLLLWRRTPQ